MGPRRDFGHDTSIGHVFLDLTSHDIRQDFAGTGDEAAHDSGRRFVAACFQPQDCECA
jgi:hypothetical protein